MKLKNSALQELYDTVVASTITISPYEASPIDKAFRECDEKLSESITFAHIKDLEDRNDILEGSNKALLEANLESISKTRKLEKEIEYAKKQLNYFTHSRDDWRDRAKHAEKEVEDLKKDKERLKGSRLEWAKKAAERNKKLIEAEGKIEELASQYQDLSIKLKRFQINVGRESRFLWDMLQKVNDAKPFELATCFPDVTCMDDILSWNLEDFLDAYESWQKKKEQERIKYMRDYLERFCRGRLCSRCPLGSDEYKCRCAYSFNGAHPIPDEDIERYYEKARACSKPVCRFEREYTFEGTINVEFNKELLNKVCGIDSDD